MQFIDNITLLLGEDVKKELQGGGQVSFAAAHFSMFAYEALKTELEALDSFRFIFNQPTFTVENATDRVRKEHREFFIPKEDRERSVFGDGFEIHLRNQLSQRAIARECADWIRRKGSFLSNRTESFMPEFGVISKPDGMTAYRGVQKFDTVALGYQPSDDLLVDIQKYDEPEHARRYLDMFERLWKNRDQMEDITDRLISHIESVYRENPPEGVYFFILYTIFTEFLEDISEDFLPNDRTGYKDSLVWNKLYSFQRDAAVGIINKLETFNGCILADSVGLGKTFTALAVIKYYELRNRSVLVLCPKKLSGNWNTFNKNYKNNIFMKDRFGFDVLAHTDLLRTKGESNGMDLGRVNWENYDLVVIDESHNFRNDNAVRDHETRYQRLLNHVIRSGVKTKVLMLSATPVNNRFTDLRNQLALAYEGDSENFSEALGLNRRVEHVFSQAQEAFNRWSEQTPGERSGEALMDTLDFDFFKLLDSVTIARSRKHIEQFYDMSEMGAFPTRLKPVTHRLPISYRDDIVQLDDVVLFLSGLVLATYTPLKYVYPSRLDRYAEQYDIEVGAGSHLKQTDREQSLVRLMTINLLKRLESSVHSFRLTLGKIHDLCANNLEAIRRFEGGDPSGAELWSSEYEDLNEDDDFWDPDDMTVGDKVKIDLKDMDLKAWKRDLEADHAALGLMLEDMQKIGPDDDAKLQHLQTQMVAKVNAPINPGNRKILVFTAFSDTAEYLYKNLAPVMKERGLDTALVTGSASPKTTLAKGYDFQSVLTLFSPRSKEKELVMPADGAEIDVIFATDCISEGQNLQDCDYLVNYDIHWNPVRIIQRFGRIDRIGSTNATIQLVNYWPDMDLDGYIRLKERVENRMAIVDLTATADDNILDPESPDLAYRKEQLRRMQEEVVDLEDVRTGVNITDLGLNDFRMDLLNFVREHGTLEGLPTGLHAVLPAQPALGLVPGVVFALRNRNHSVNIMRLNRLHPYYLVYVSDDGTVIADHLRVKRILDLARAGSQGRSEPETELCRRFNHETKDGRQMEHYSELLNKAIDSIVSVKERGEVDSLFSSNSTEALEGGIKGLEDFELIAFLVIREGV